MPLKTPEVIDAHLCRTFAAKTSVWLMRDAFGLREEASAGEEESTDTRIRLPLGRTTEKESAGSLIAVRNLCRRWRETAARREGWHLETKSVRWRTVGLSLDLPAAITVDSPEKLCKALSPGGVTQSQWMGGIERLKQAARFFDIAVMQTNREILSELVRVFKNCRVLWSKNFDEAEFDLLLRLVDWLITHPDSGAFVREIPLTGLDTKWLERHLKEVCGLFNLVRHHRFGTAPCLTGDFMREAGLRVKPLFVRVRHAQHWRPGNAQDVIQLTLDEIKRMEPACDTVVIIENEQTGLSIDIDANIPILIGMGYGAAALSQVQWLASKRILYFGDLDTHGLAILSDVRRAWPQTQSVLMDRQTLEDFRTLAVIEPRQVANVPEMLTAEEKELFEELSRTGLRLEQERIAIDVINAELRRALTRL